MMLGSQNIAETPKRSILGEVTNSRYVSPTANLKMLTNVALQNAYHRKEKSLQILCDRFLELYPLYGCTGRTEIHLDATAQRLGVEKRRIYDIINILEALQFATHRRKNTYAWHGAVKLGALLATLKSQGHALGIKHALHGRQSAVDPPKHKSLGILAQRFLMMFLVEPPNSLINLEMAIAVLISPPRFVANGTDPPQHDRQHKSKVRRLYDISNVLSSIGLIEKVSTTTILKKPVFRYVGPKCLPAKPSTPLLTTAQMTPVSLVVRTNSVMYSCPSRSKRKLVFSSPSYPSSPASCSSTPPLTPCYKWDVMLQVADMELNRLNSTTM